MERIEGGCRTRGIPVPNSDGPILSVVTIVYNRLEDLKITLPNVLAQSYESIEYIIVDGASTDGCREYIQEHDERIAYWVSEPDKGLYDAMNKGLSLAKGDYVWFMNSGDEIFESDTCQKMVDGLIGDPDVIFGETMMIDEARKEVGLRSEITTQRLPEELHWKSLERGMVVCHQSILVRTSIAEPYILNHPFSADIDWVIKALKKSKGNHNAHQILSRYLMGGFSKKNHRKSLLDRFEILKSHYGLIPTLWNHLWIVLRAMFSSPKY
ncbi:MAG TPA: glycosyl transferase [Flavobacteriales bacterium]|jgi:glycosyltransferase involved in cell wall biosynthesis|nr:glycosyl transferase [Flavobacteriales bacterium]